MEPCKTVIICSSVQGCMHAVLPTLHSCLPMALYNDCQMLTHKLCDAAFEFAKYRKLETPESCRMEKPKGKHQSVTVKKCI